LPSRTGRSEQRLAQLDPGPGLDALDLVGELDARLQLDRTTALGKRGDVLVQEHLAPTLDIAAEDAAQVPDLHVELAGHLGTDELEHRKLGEHHRVGALLLLGQSHHRTDQGRVRGAEIGEFLARGWRRLGAVALVADVLVEQAGDQASCRGLELRAQAHVDAHVVDSARQATQVRHHLRRLAQGHLAVARRRHAHHGVAGQQDQAAGEQQIGEVQRQRHRAEIEMQELDDPTEPDAVDQVPDDAGGTQPPAVTLGTLAGPVGTAAKPEQADQHHADDHRWPAHRIADAGTEAEQGSRVELCHQRDDRQASERILCTEQGERSDLDHLVEQQQTGEQGQTVEQAQHCLQPSSAEDPVPAGTEHRWRESATLHLNREVRR
jgi:hypothetical protein